MTGVGHVPPLEAGELRRAAGRVEVIDAGLHQRVPGGRAREPQRGVGVLVPSHRATRFRCASGNGKARSRGCVFPLGDGRVEGDARPRSATLRAKAMRFTRCSAADTRVRVAVAVVGVARDVQCESGRARSPLVSCRELSSRVPRDEFFRPSLKRPFFIKSLFVWAITLRHASRTSRKQTPVRDSSFSRSRNRSGASSRVPVFAFSATSASRSPSASRARDASEWSARTRGVRPKHRTPAGRGRAEPGRDERAGSRAGARAGTSFGWVILPLRGLPTSGAGAVEP